MNKARRSNLWGIAGIAAFVCCVCLGQSALAACPSADLNGDCVVNFLDFQMMASQGSLLDLHTMAAQWLETDDDPPTILSQVDMQTEEPNSFAVQFVVVGKQRLDRTVFQYECEVILTNLSAATFENAQLVMVAWPDNMTVIDPHVSFGGAPIEPGESAAGIDTCTFTVDRSQAIDPAEIIWRYVTAPPDMVFIPGGTFQMGGHHCPSYSCPFELPLHQVLSDSFFMNKYEITNQQYCDYLNSARDACDIKIYDSIVYALSDTNDSLPYCSAHSADFHAQIDYSGGIFSVRSKGGRSMANDPMVEVSWYGAAAYCNWRSQQEGKEQRYNLSTWDCDFSKHGYRLPTEAEWEYAARAGLEGRRFPWGDTISHSQANYYSRWDEGCPHYPYDVSPTPGYHPTWNDGVHPYTSPVGSFAANAYGLYDMVGNIWEWCNDWYHSDYYDHSPTSNPTGPTSGTDRVLRGGCFTDRAVSCRIAVWGCGRPDRRRDINGFRIILDL